MVCLTLYDLSLRLVLTLRPHRAGLRLARKLVVFEDDPPKRDRDELFGVDLPDPLSDVAASNTQLDHPNLLPRQN